MKKAMRTIVYILLFLITVPLGFIAVIGGHLLCVIWAINDKEPIMHYFEILWKGMEIGIDIVRHWINTGEFLDMKDILEDESE